MVAAVARDPSREVSGPSRTAGGPARQAPTAPRLVHRPISPAGPTPPLRAGEAVTAVHTGWAALGGEPEPHARGGTLGGLAERLLDKLVRTAQRAGGRESERELLARLVRAVDALAVRADELAGRVDNLESALEELVTAVSEDLVAIRAGGGSARARRSGGQAASSTTKRAGTGGTRAGTGTGGRATGGSGRSGSGGARSGKGDRPRGRDGSSAGGGSSEAGDRSGPPPGGEPRDVSGDDESGGAPGDDA